MRLLYDLQVFSMQRYGGASRYFYEVASRLRERADDIAVEFAGRYASNEYLGALGVDVTDLLHRYRGRGRGSLVALADWLNARRTERAIDHGGVGVHHPTYFHTIPRERLQGPAVALTVFDMIHELFDLPDSREIRVLKRRAVERADAIIAISKNTSEDLQRLLAIPAEKITVIHLGCSFTGEELGDQSLLLPARFVLHVGSRLGYKNFMGLMEAMAPLMTADEGLRLVCAGGGPLNARELGRARELGIDERLIATPADDSSLAAQYRRATLFVCASRYEGFGLPLLEAMTFGCACAASNAASLPEVGAEAVRYFDPDSTEEITATLGALLADDVARAELSAAGRRRAADFSWDASAAAHAALYLESSS